MSRIVIVDWDVPRGEDTRVVVLEHESGFGWKALANRKGMTPLEIASCAAQLAMRYDAMPMVELGIGNTPGQAIAYELEQMLGPDWSPRPQPRLRNL